MKRERGFTLLEILVVLSLLGVLIGLLGTFVLNATASQARADLYATRLDEVRGAQRFLRAAISQALPLATDVAQAKAPRFIGAADQLVFVAPLPDSLGGGLYQQRISNSEHRLQVRFARLMGQVLLPVGEVQLLLDDVQQMSFSYRGLSPQAQDSGWLAAWPWPERLPRQVRIQAHLQGPLPWVTEEINLRLDLAGEVGSE